MNKIVSKEHFSANVVKLEVEAPLIARSRKAGHFVIVKVGEKGERIPLTIAGADTTKGTITLVIQAVGGSSKKICELNAGEGPCRTTATTVSSRISSLAERYSTASPTFRRF